jgi:hypothetical protein
MGPPVEVVVFVVMAGCGRPTSASMCAEDKDLSFRCLQAQIKKKSNKNKLKCGVDRRLRDLYST